MRTDNKRKTIIGHTAKVVSSALIASLIFLLSGAAAAEEDQVDFGPYMSYVQKRVKSHWSPSHISTKAFSVVLFKIHQTGTISDLKLDKSSGVRNIDQAAMSAVEKAAPFDPLPPGSAENVDIQFSFDYKAYSNNLIIQNMRANRTVDLEKALAQKEKQLGPEHQEIAVAIRNLADEVCSHGEYRKAEPLYKRAVALQEKHLPEAERELAITLTKFGELFYLQKKYADAEPLYKEALAINERFPTNNSFLQADLEHYAKLLYVTNRISQANEIYNRLKDLHNQQQQKK